MWLHFIIIGLILFWGLTVTGFNGEKNKKIFLFVIFTILYLMSALRASSIGNDTSEYIRVFNNIANTGDISKYSDSFEIGYLILNSITAYLSENSQTIIIVTSLIIIVGFARFIYKYSNNIWFSTYLFFSMNFFTDSMNTIRTSLAMVILLYSYDFIKKKKLLKFIITVILATLFHQTAIVFLIAWFVPKFNFNRKLLIYSVIFGLAGFLFFPILMKIILTIFPSYVGYLDSSYILQGIQLGSLVSFLMNLAIFIFCVIMYKKNKEYKKLTKDSFINSKNIIILMLFGLIISFISLNFSLLNRVSEYFMVFSIIYIPNVLKYIDNKYLKVNLTYLIVVLFLVYTGTVFLLRPEWNLIYPYKLFFSQ